MHPLVYEDNGSGIFPCDKEKIFLTGYDEGTSQGLFLLKDLFSYTRIQIRKNWVYGSCVQFEMEVPDDQFRFKP